MCEDRHRRYPQHTQRTTGEFEFIGKPKNDPAEGERRHGEILAAQSQGGKSHHRAQQGRRYSAGDKGEFERPMLPV